MGNRTTADGVVATFDANDRPSGQSFDANGNQTSVNGQAAAYDFENKLASVGSGISYLYDADGKRVAKSEGGQ